MKNSWFFDKNCIFHNFLNIRLSRGRVSHHRHWKSSSKIYQFHSLLGWTKRYGWEPDFAKAPRLLVMIFEVFETEVWSLWPDCMNYLRFSMTRRAFSPSSKSNTGTVGASWSFSREWRIHDFLTKIAFFIIFWTFVWVEAVFPITAIEKAPRKSINFIHC